MRDRYECALRDLLTRQLQEASPVPTFVTLPREARALAVAQAILRNPAEPKPMGKLRFLDNRDCDDATMAAMVIELGFSLGKPALTRRPLP